MKPVDKMTLEELVEQANRGTEAEMRLIDEFKDQVENRNVDDITGWRSVFEHKDNLEEKYEFVDEYFLYRVKPKPSFCPEETR